MKKTTAALLAFLFVVIIAGCGVNDTTETKNPDASGMPSEHVGPNAIADPDVNFGPASTAQPATASSAPEYEWTGQVKKAILSNLDESEWAEPLTTWELATDEPSGMEPSDGFAVYAITNGDYCYPAVMYGPDIIQKEQLSHYQDSFGIIVSSSDRKQVYGCDIIYDTDGLFMEELDSDDIHIDGEYIVIDRDGYCRAIWIQKYDTGAYLKHTVTIRDENAVAIASEYCEGAWGIDLDVIRDEGNEFVLTR